MGIAERIKVMIVDDQVTSRLLLTEALQQLGFRHINVAKDGHEAPENLIREPHHLVISKGRLMISSNEAAAFFM